MNPAPALPVLLATKGGPLAIAISTDTLVSGVHFFADVNPHALGHKAAAVNLSDIAAMGGEPIWLLMHVYGRTPDLAWRQQFVRGADELGGAYNCKPHVTFVQRDSLRISVQAAGRVGAGPLLRSQAANGDLVLVTGTLGDAGAALALLQRSQFQRNNPHHLALLARLERPTPRVNAGMRLAGIANSALDVSDGLSGDVRHLFRGVLGAQITPTSLPLSQALSASFSAVEAREFALGAGDDYELCFTVSPDNLDKALLACEQANVAATVVGKMVDNGGCLELTEPCGETPVGAKSTHGFQHF